MRQLPLVEEAMGRQALDLLRHLDAACTSADDLEHATTESFNQHPDAGIITSFPGLGPLTGARVLAETAGRYITRGPLLPTTHPPAAGTQEHPPDPWPVPPHPGTSPPGGVRPFRTRLRSAQRSSQP